MLQASWSWWEIIALGGLAWTFVSFLFALALGRVLRASQAYEVDETSAREELEDNADRPTLAPPVSLLESQPVRVSVQEPSLLDQLVPADIVGEDDASVNRASGTRFKPVESGEEEYGERAMTTR